MSYILEQSYTDKRETRKLIEDVLESAFESVVGTMGPNSDLACIIERNKPVVTKDGVRVAKALEFNDIRKNVIAELITSAAIKTDELVGDGTTTTVFMTYQMYHKFNSLINFNSIRFISHLINLTKDHLSNMVSEVTVSDEKFKRMVYTTANYEVDIAEQVIELFRKYKNPRVSLKSSRGNPEDVIEVHNDISFEGRYASPHLTPSTYRSAIDLENIGVLILDNQINTINQSTLQILGESIINNPRQVVIMSRNFDPETTNKLASLNALIGQKLSIPKEKNMLFIIPFSLSVAGTSGGNVIKDLSRMIGVDVFTEFPEGDALKQAIEVNIDKLHLEMNQIVFSRKNPDYVKKADMILSELEPVLEEMTITERANMLGKLLQNRIGRLRAENVTITVSGMTAGEVSERLYLYEDAVRVAETCLRFGVIEGIGYGYNMAAEMLHETVATPLEQKGEEEGLSNKEAFELDLTKMFIEVLTSQYTYLTGEHYEIGGCNVYIDLARGEVLAKPEYVFDNGCAAISALEAAWSVAKSLSRLSVVIGKSNNSSEF